MNSKDRSPLDSNQLIQNLKLFEFEGMSPFWMKAEIYEIRNRSKRENSLNDSFIQVDGKLLPIFNSVEKLKYREEFSSNQKWSLIEKCSLIIFRISKKLPHHLRIEDLFRNIFWFLVKNLKKQKFQYLLSRIAAKRHEV